MEFVRTEEAAFSQLNDYPFSPIYRHWSGLRLAHIDEGPRDAPIALLVHGEPTWGYLYRKMILGLLTAGYRVVVPDHAGFGRSDKPTDDNWYTIAKHVDALGHLIASLDLRRITLFVQDWGGPIGLRQVTSHPARFERLVILNTWLHHENYDYSPSIKWWRSAALDPTQLGGDMPTGAIVAGSLRREGQNKEAVYFAYNAPYPSINAKAGARRFPFCLPFAEPDLGQALEQARDYAVLPTLDMPKHLIFGDADEIFTADWGRAWATSLPGATFDTIPGAGHFVQEEAGAEIVSTYLARRGT